MSRRALALAALSVSIVGATLAAPPASAATPDRATALRYAPEFRFHSQESYWPTIPSAYVIGTDLRFSRNNNTDPKIADGTPYRLGSRANNPYRYSHNGRTYTTLQNTRPYGSSRAAGLSANEGFYLEVVSNGGGVPRTGTKPTTSTGYSGAPIYYDFVKPSSTATYTDIVYWVFYAYNNAPQDKEFGAYDHEGDWEGVTVRVDSRLQPIGVYYYGHGCTHSEVWRYAPKTSTTHPVVYTAKGSHASYPRVEDGRPDRCDAPPPALAEDYVNGSGRRWQTWTNTNRIQPVRDQQWYGYGGGWGRVGVRKDSTGPAGPSQFKLRPL